MSYSLHSIKGVIEGIIRGTTIGAIKGDSRSFSQWLIFFQRLGVI